MNDDSTPEVLPLPPYEVPEQDRDLLTTGHLDTEETLHAAGFIQCAVCSEWRPARFKEFCSRACEDKHRQEALEDTLRRYGRGQPTSLHYIETPLLTIALTNRFRAMGHDVSVEVDPQNGELIYVGGVSYVRATQACITYGPPCQSVPTTRLYETLQDLLCITIVPYEGRPPRPPMIPKTLLPREIPSWVYDLHVYRRMTFAQIGGLVGRSRSLAQQAYSRVVYEGHQIALRRVAECERPVPKLERVLLTSDEVERVRAQLLKADCFRGLSDITVSDRGWYFEGCVRTDSVHFMSPYLGAYQRHDVATAVRSTFVPCDADVASRSTWAPYPNGSLSTP